jgi:SAM-dependent methyltransferase
VSKLTTVTACRSCGHAPLRPILSLGRTPLANSLLPAEGGTSPTFPLDLMRCTGCGLVQIAQIVAPEALFSDYVYFSSNSEMMLRHAEQMAQKIVRAEQLTDRHLVVELASNDGYLLQYFKQRHVSVLGIEPAANIARVAEQDKGIRTLARFFSHTLARELVTEGTSADVIIGNNVLAHVPDLNDFVAGVATLLKRSGVAIFEAPYLRDMLQKVEFDTIYHEHQCYFSVTALRHVFDRHGLEIVDVERVAIHGGSLRVSVAPKGERTVEARVAEIVDEELAWGVLEDAPYTAFVSAVERLKIELRTLLDELKASGARLAAYGAAAKGVTLASYCQIGANDLEFVVDRSPQKQGHRFPFDGMSILPPSALAERRPDYALLFTWNFAEEILRQQSEYTERGGRFIVPVPTPTISPSTPYSR